MGPAIPENRASVLRKDRLLRRTTDVKGRDVSESFVRTLHGPGGEWLGSRCPLLQRPSHRGTDVRRRRFPLLYCRLLESRGQRVRGLLRPPRGR
jgi:hypothetical protein